MAEYVAAILSTVHFIQTFKLYFFFMASKKKEMPYFKLVSFYVVARLKHLNFQANKIFMQTLFTLNKLMSAWLS